MVSISQPESKPLHPQARFVTTEAIALLLQLKPEQIYRIDCWQYVIHVVGKGISTFVSYADLPPILGVKPPQPKDFLIWRKRWKKNKNKAPQFWVEFYARKFQTVLTIAEMYGWGELVAVIKPVLPETALQWLRNEYIQRKQVVENF